jgi:tetratricopeptide (TPR) repeat protein
MLHLPKSLGLADARDTHFARGKAHYDRKNYRSALADFAALLKIDPTHAEGYHLRSHCHDFLGNLDAALADVNKAIQNRAGDSHLHDMRGGYHFRRQEYDQAVPDLLRVRELGKEDALASRRLAWIYLAGPDKLRDTKQGLAMAQRAAAQEKSQGAETLTLLGLAHLRLRDHAKAADYLARVAKLETGVSTGIVLLAQAVCHHHAGQTDQAQQHYEKALAWRKAYAKLSDPKARLFEALRAEAQALLASLPKDKNTP